VPQITFMDLYVLPTSTLEILHENHEAHIRAIDTTIAGSHHVESLDCDNRFTLDLHVLLKKTEDDMCAPIVAREQ
jgi:hypothetical protein